MLVGFDVSAGRQSQPGADVIHQLAAAVVVVGVDHDDVAGDEVQVWGSPGLLGRKTSSGSSSQRSVSV
jgi:hypothetical protein